MDFIGNRYKHIPAEDCVTGIAKGILSLKYNKKIEYKGNIEDVIRDFSKMYSIPKRVFSRDSNDVEFQIYNDEIFEDKILLAFDVISEVVLNKNSMLRNHTDDSILNRLRTYHQWK